MTTIETTTDFIGPCAEEDATNCYWNAPTMGNGTGTSFVDINGVNTEIEGCQPGQGLPAVDIDANGIPWAYCERALGNDTVPQATEPIEGPTDTIYIPETGEIVQESTGEVVEVVQTTQGADEVYETTELALTGPEDISPLTIILGFGALLLGLAIRKVATRA